MVKGFEIDFVNEKFEAPSWPLVWKITPCVGKWEATDEKISGLMEALEAKLKAIDDQDRYVGAVASEEFVTVLEGIKQTIEDMSFVFPHGKVSPCHQLSVKLLAPICGAVVMRMIETTSERIQEAVLDPVNNPTRGKFNRKIEWTIVDNEDRTKLELHLNPRPGYAVWLEKDRIRVEEERRVAEAEATRPKSVAEKLQAVVSRPNSVKEALQVGAILANQTYQSWVESSSGEEEEDEGTQEKKHDRKSKQDVRKSRKADVPNN